MIIQPDMNSADETGFYRSRSGDVLIMHDHE